MNIVTVETAPRLCGAAIMPPSSVTVIRGVFTE